MPGKRLCLEQRETIERCWGAGWTKTRIAVAVGVAVSTIGREITRNGGGAYGPRHPLRKGPRGRPNLVYHGRYSARDAHRHAGDKARRPRVGKLAGNGWMQSYVLDGLRLRWSPAQIAGRLRQDFPDKPERWVSAEAIYLAIYIRARGGLKDLLEGRVLRTGRVHRRGYRPSGTRARFADLPTLGQRPAEADDREVVGHFEGDLVIGTGGRSGIATIVERSSRYTTLVLLPDKGFHDPTTVAKAVAAKFLELPKDLRRSLTWDRGFEMVYSHKIFTALADCAAYFADPHAPWQRGTNENTNGLIREYYPKGAFDFDTITQADLDAVADQLNNRPRRVLGFRTPNEVFNEALLLATAS
jgi:IS30 family transposase